MIRPLLSLTHIMIFSGVSTPPCGSSDLQHEWESERWNRTGHDDLDTESDGPPRVRRDVVV